METDSERADDLPGVIRCYVGCATFLSGEPQGRYVLRLDAGRKRVTMRPLVDARSSVPTIQEAVRVDLRRQDVSVRPTFGDWFAAATSSGSPRSKHRQAEAAYRAEHDLAEDLDVPQA